MIKHLRANGILASRDDAFARISPLVDLARLSLEGRVAWVFELLQKNSMSRPKRKKSLLTTIHSLFRKELPESDVEQIVTAMAARKLVVKAKLLIDYESLQPSTMGGEDVLGPGSGVNRATMSSSGGAA